LCWRLDVGDTEADTHPQKRVLSAHNELDLSNAPALTKLYCGNNQLRELDLSIVPELIELDCSHNELTELNL
jgi:Leucine-rich repeat (LRR) protein